VNLWWLTVAGAGMAILAASVAGARHPTIHPTEARVFHAINGLPGWLYPVLWAPMQLGNLVVGTAAGWLVALVDRDLALAAIVTAAAGLKLVIEKVVRREVAAYLTVRQRPGTSQVGAIRRGDVPESGPSFPSGHVILVAAIGTVVAPMMPGEWWWAPALAAVLVAVGRVYVGAHNPLDVTAGLGAGLLLGGALAVFQG
jgi:undecaprenyl-diphosphatase